ncbi:hypothetical protein L210DRAFT_3561219 [Boletus edulis BED1]|uniref:Uncharacterized protein n=1 Tax=Boletus edulis BED1 TaxID=1328754 RepID=A0AAD4G8P2_BOLED|nr:hypothetical protein L210DRAFT_3561219 [Boletus edulis BED1]
MSTHQPTEKKQPSFGDKMKGVAHIAHGVGEDFRGSVMGAFESVSGSDESKAKQQDIASKVLLLVPNLPRRPRPVRS